MPIRWWWVFPSVSSPPSRTDQGSSRGFRHEHHRRRHDGGRLSLAVPLQIMHALEIMHALVSTTRVQHHLRRKKNHHRSARRSMQSTYVRWRARGHCTFSMNQQYNDTSRLLNNSRAIVCRRTCASARGCVWGHLAWTIADGQREVAPHHSLVVLDEGREIVGYRTARGQVSHESTVVVHNECVGLLAAVCTDMSPPVERYVHDIACRRGLPTKVAVARVIQVNWNGGERRRSRRTRPSPSART